MTTPTTARFTELRALLTRARLLDAASLLHPLYSATRTNLACDATELRLRAALLSGLCTRDEYNADMLECADARAGAEAVEQRATEAAWADEDGASWERMRVAMEDDGEAIPF
jgi:hypothetical protein